MENGIFLFGLTQTHGMPILIETGVLLDVLAGVMVAGLIAFRIKKNFEHIDVSMLSELKEGW
jgi:hydrogenase-4 component E